MVESMEELFLCTFFSYDKLDIIYKKNIIVPVFFTELGHSEFASRLTCFQCVDQLVRKCLAGDVEYLFGRIIFKDKMGNGMHKMRFSEPDSSIYKKRIINFTRRFCNCQRSCMCKVIIASYHKGIESVFRIQVCLLKK